MTLLEILAAISIIGFLVAVGFALKTWFATKEATNVWLLFAMGFGLMAAENLFVFSVHLNGALGFFEQLEKSLELAGIALIFSALAVYGKEKVLCKSIICDGCKKKKAEGKILNHAKKFGDGV